MWRVALLQLRTFTMEVKESQRGQSSDLLTSLCSSVTSVIQVLALDRSSDVTLTGNPTVYP
jgi:hypothetical protein